MTIVPFWETRTRVVVIAVVSVHVRVRVHERAREGSDKQHGADDGESFEREDEGEFGVVELV